MPPVCHPCRIWHAAAENDEAVEQEQLKGGCTADDTELSVVDVPE